MGSRKWGNVTKSSKVCGKAFFLLFAFHVALLAIPAFAQPLHLPDSAVAERYAQWAQETIAQGHWPQALAGLERAADFADEFGELSTAVAGQLLKKILDAFEETVR
jgi:hypothetical protein